MEYPLHYQTFGNQYNVKAKQRKQLPKLQHHQTDSTKGRQQVWFHTGPQPKSTNQKLLKSISFPLRTHKYHTHTHTPCLPIQISIDKPLNRNTPLTEPRCRFDKRNDDLLHKH